jgi:hypothetical protein
MIARGPAPLRAAVRRERCPSENIYISIFFNKISVNPAIPQNRHATLISEETMSTKAEAARINGVRSIGPVTEEGKTTSSRNSLTHGLTSARVVLPHESQEEFDHLEAGIAKHFNPISELERELVHEMAAARWRLRRIEEMEAALFQKFFREQQEALGTEADPIAIRQAAYVELAESKSFRMLSRHQSQLRRAYEKAWKEIEALKEQRREEEQANLQNEPKRRLTPAMIELLTAPPVSRNTRFAPGSLSAGPVRNHAVAAGQ